MIVEVDSRDPLPPYEQIRRQVLALVASGELPPGTRLPAIRQLAGDLGVAPNTAARAYRELEGVGVLSSRRRHGTSVTADARERALALLGRAPTALPPASPSLDPAAREYIGHVLRLGRTLDEALDAVRRNWERGPEA
ncbi:MULTISPECIES: GntR family transcriptional regulator [Nocardiopsis]|uniref:GntR family transcriptional regulator n=1 Tax=Nocardiopsis alba TaxID=53437 RepID=A0ABV5DYI2_9ACTN|nr:GntR family transcriptional regulator [Nocardiopsis sp. LDBS1602]MEC3892809.1 GntR family transcriptional regulator [Nocardiopsis sp. LDBS1602]